jgi:hypothetical protein
VSFLLRCFSWGGVRDVEAQARKMSRIAVVNPADHVSDIDPATGSPKYRLGYIEGRNLVVARRFLAYLPVAKC